MKKSILDEALTLLPDAIGKEVAPLLRLHKKLMDIFENMGAPGKRSLASKYLHFHRPELFFIDDSRARKGISKILIPQLPVLNAGLITDSDVEYFSFFHKCLGLKIYIKETFNKNLTPREIDKILLRLAKA